jgi:GDP-4-dehydro-6-deoxy-D-mannose reductase
MPGAAQTGRADDGAARRILITGGAGFVGPHLVRALARRFEGVEIHAASLEGAPVAGASPLALDVTDAAGLAAAFAAVRPTAVFHLAGATHVQGSARDPDWAWTVNLHGTLRVAEAALAAGAALVHVSTGEVYGLSANAGQALDEDAVLRPANHYAVTKAAADLAVGEMALRGLKAVRFRPFNHTGPGQSPGFVVPHIAAQIARAEAGLGPAVVRIGRTDRARDFLDVRDVAEAYALGLSRIDALEPGVAINLASGRPLTVQWAMDRLLAAARVPMTVEQDAGALRPNDVAEVRGDAGRARTLLGWAPEFAFEDTVDAVLEDWRERVLGEARA